MYDVRQLVLYPISAVSSYHVAGTWQTAGHVEQIVLSFHMESVVYTPVLIVVIF